MNYVEQGKIAWIGHCKGLHDGENPYKPGTDAHEQWEKGWQMMIDQQWREIENEEQEQDKQIKLL